MARGPIPSILDDEEIKKLAKQLEGRKPIKGSRQRFTSRGEGNKVAELAKLGWNYAWTGNPEGRKPKVTTKGSKRRNVRLREQEQAALDAAAEKLKGIKTGRPSQIPRLSREWDLQAWRNSAEYKSLGIPMEGSRDRINQALNRSQRQIDRHGGPTTREIALDSKNDIRESTAPKLPETGWSNVFTKDKDGNMLGVMTRNQRLAWEKANFQQQQNLIEPGKLGLLGTNVQQTAGEKFTQQQNNLVNNKELYNKIDMKEGSKIFNKGMNTDVNFDWSKNAESLLKDKEGLLGDKKASLPKKTDIKKLAQNLGIETRPWKLILNAVAAFANPNKGDKQLPFDNKMGQMAANLAREGTEGIPQDPDPYSWA